MRSICDMHMLRICACRICEAYASHMRVSHMLHICVVRICDAYASHMRMPNMRSICFAYFAVICCHICEAYASHIVLSGVHIDTYKNRQIERICFAYAICVCLICEAYASHILLSFAVIYAKHMLRIFCCLGSI